MLRLLDESDVERDDRDLESEAKKVCERGIASSLLFACARFGSSGALSGAPDGGYSEIVNGREGSFEGIRFLLNLTCCGRLPISECCAKGDRMRPGYVPPLASLPVARASCPRSPPRARPCRGRPSDVCRAHCRRA
eukprot:3165798-Pleurochrysis_carterae.AAC.1